MHDFDKFSSLRPLFGVKTSSSRPAPCGQYRYRRDLQKHRNLLSPRRRHHGDWVYPHQQSIRINRSNWSYTCLRSRKSMDARSSIRAAILPSRRTSSSPPVRAAVELRDGDKARFGGKGVRKAVSHVNGEIRTALLKQDASDQKRIDQIMIDLDGTSTKGRLGANAILAVSLANTRTTTQETHKPQKHKHNNNKPKQKPEPKMNVIN